MCMLLNFVITSISGSYYSLGHNNDELTQRLTWYEYQLRLGRQRQVWFIPLADKRGVYR